MERNGENRIESERNVESVRQRGRDGESGQDR
jgi:hypothetical protein